MLGTPDGNGTVGAFPFVHAPTIPASASSPAAPAIVRRRRWLGIPRRLELMSGLAPVGATTFCVFMPGPYRRTHERNLPSPPNRPLSRSQTPSFPAAAEARPTLY